LQYLSGMTAKSTLRPLALLWLGALGLLPATSCGGTSKSTVGSGGTGGTGNTVEVGTCESPMAVGNTGWIQCDTGILHRESVGSCPLPLDLGPTCGECPASGYPWCLPVGFQTSVCVAGCADDSYCAAGEVCFCQGDSPGRCVPAGCATDGDCGAGLLCATYEGPPEPACSYFVAGVACQSPEDQCLGSECNCVLKNDRRECVPGIGGCGGTG
jgi:hypothetical protein